MTPEEKKEYMRKYQNCWSLKNLQPLWAIDNIRKGNKCL